MRMYCYNNMFRKIKKNKNVKTTIGNGNLKVSYYNNNKTNM